MRQQRRGSVHPRVPPGRGGATSPGTGLKKQHQPQHSGCKGTWWAWLVAMCLQTLRVQALQSMWEAMRGSRQGTHGAGGAAGSELRARGAAAAVAVVVGTASKCHPASSLGHP